MAVSPDSGEVRFVGIPGGGMEEVFPPPRPPPGSAGPLDKPLSVSSSSCEHDDDLVNSRDDETGSSQRATVGHECAGNQGEARVKSASTQFPEVKPSDWANTRRRWVKDMSERLCTVVL